MAAPTPRRPAGAATGLKGRATAKVGPLPVYGWVLLIAGGYFAYRHFRGAGGSSASATTTPTSGTVGGAGDSSGAAGGASTTAAGDPNAGALDALTALLGQQTAAITDLAAQQQAQQSQQAGLSSSTNADPYTNGTLGFDPTNVAVPHAVAGTQLDTTVSRNGVTEFTPIVSSTPSAMVGNVNHPYATPATAPNFAATAQQKTAAAKGAGAQAPFGGVVSTRTLANGSTLTTYASGRQVQQVPGKSAYVVKA